jgi:hypothetical protein
MFRNRDSPSRAPTIPFKITDDTDDSLHTTENVLFELRRLWPHVRADGAVVHADEIQTGFVEAHAGLVGEALQFSLPEPQSLAVRAAALVRNLRLRYLVDQCRCRFEIGGCEALGKPLVHWHQKLTCLFAPSLVTPQSGEVGGATQFP